MIGPAPDRCSPSEVVEAVSGGYYLVAWKLTQILSPPSLVQALLTVLSQVLRFMETEWYLPLLVSSLVLGWLNLLYYTRGFQHTGIYSVMIQKVRDGVDQVRPD